MRFHKLDPEKISSNWSDLVQETPTKLKFTRSLEQAFTTYYLGRNLPMIRRNAYVSISCTISATVSLALYIGWSQFQALVPWIGAMVAMSCGQVALTHDQRLFKNYETIIVPGGLAYALFAGHMFGMLPTEWFGILFPLMMLLILGTYFALGTRSATACVTALASSVVWAYVLFDRGIYPTVYGGKILTVCYLGLANFVGFSVMKSAERNRRSEFLMLLELNAARNTSDSLLLNVMPAKIAQRLKDGADSIADFHGEVTVLFADLVGFTAMSAKLHAKEIVALLDELFSAFDDATDALKLEKIKTVGDAYMAVAGLPEARSDHAEAALDLALALKEAATALGTARGVELGLRIGVHSGPVVAGVIGKRKFVYDIWGDTVNAASRLESSAPNGTILVSEETRLLVGKKFEFIRRDTELRGRGKAVAHLLTGRVPVSLVA